MCIRDSTYGLDHVLAELIFGFMQPRGIDKYELGEALGEHAGDAGAGGLGPARDDGHLLPHQLSLIHI